MSNRINDMRAARLEIGRDEMGTDDRPGAGGDLVICVL